MQKLNSETITQWITSSFPEYKICSGGRQIRIHNPFDGDTDHHLWVSTEYRGTKKDPKRKNYWVHDFRPGKEQYNSSFINFVKRYRNVSYYQALNEICGGSTSLRGALGKVRRKKEEDQEPAQEQGVELPALNKPMTDREYPTAHRIAANYLRSRGVSLERAIQLQLHYTPSTLVFPYLEYDEIVYWQEREIIAKRFNFPDEKVTGLVKTDYLYNFDDVEPCDYLIVVESIFNCISLGQNCVATGGATIAGRQPDKIGVLNPNVVILAPDHDEAGIKSLRHNYFLLHKGYQLAYSLPPAGMDWNDLEQRDGLGSARRYLEDHIYKLSLPTLLRLQATLTGKQLV